MTTIGQNQPHEEDSRSETGSDTGSRPVAPSTPGAGRIKVWVYYNPMTGEATLYDSEPPLRFGRRQGDADFVEVDEALVKEYATTKELWYGVHAKFVAAVKAAHSRKLIDWE
jgi:hypothetical protein